MGEYKNERKKYSEPRNLSPWHLLPWHLLWLFVLILLLCSCAYNGQEQVEGDGRIDDRVTVTFVGDITMHKRQIQKYYTGENNEFDVSKGLCFVKEYLDGSDYSVGNLETTMAGTGKGQGDNVLGYSGFPRFNSPDSLGEALGDAGIDMLQTANNHCMDTGIYGLGRTLDVLDSENIAHTGTYRSQNEAETPCIVNIGSLTFGFVAYTFEINANAYVTDRPYAVNSLHSYDEKYVEEMYLRVEQLKNTGVDVVCVLIHWGEEYQEYPDKWQEEVADGLITNGADVIIGGHPHNVQPAQIKTVEDKNGKQRKGYIFYSLGDFLSDAVYDEDGINKDLGIMVSLTFSCASGNVADIEIIPTHIYETADNVGVVPVLGAVNEREKYGFLSDKDWERLEYGKTHIIDVLTSMNYLGMDTEWEIQGNVIHQVNVQTH